MYVITVIFIWIQNSVTEDRIDPDLGRGGMKSGFISLCLCESAYQTEPRLEVQFQVCNRVSDTEPDTERDSRAL